MNFPKKIMRNKETGGEQYDFPAAGHALKNIVTARNILMRESNLYQAIEKLKRILQEDAL